jgi:hypothetical protein
MSRKATPKWEEYMRIVSIFQDNHIRFDQIFRPIYGQGLETAFIKKVSYILCDLTSHILMFLEEDKGEDPPVDIDMSGSRCASTLSDMSAGSGSCFASSCASSPGSSPSSSIPVSSLPPLSQRSSPLPPPPAPPRKLLAVQTGMSSVLSSAPSKKSRQAGKHPRTHRRRRFSD